MQTVSYQQVLGLISQIATADGEPDVALEATLNTFINFRVREAWRSFDWPDLCPVERRWFRPFWNSATTYAAGDEVFHPESGMYLQALKGANLNQLPATLVGGSYEVNGAWWSQSLACYETTTQWASSVSYAVGDQVLYSGDQEVYQCHTAHTSSASFDSTKFGKLTAFVRYISPTQTGRSVIGELLEAYPKNPEVDPGVRPLKLSASYRGSIVADDGNPSCWIRFRKPVPTFSGAAYDAALTYSADQRVFYGEDYYVALGTVAPGVTPPASPWSKLEFPAVLWGTVSYFAYADWLKSDGQHDKSRLFESMGVSARDSEIDNIIRQQNTHRRLPVRNS